MNKPRKLQKGDKVAIVSLSSGMLGEDFCRHNIEIGTRRLKEYGLEPVFYAKYIERDFVFGRASRGESKRFEAGVYGGFHSRNYLCNRRR